MSSLPFSVSFNEGDNGQLKAAYSLHIGMQIRKVRRARSFTQAELAEKAGLATAYIGFLENGRYHPSAFVVWKIAKVLRVSTAALLDR